MRGALERRQRRTDAILGQFDAILRIRMRFCSFEGDFAVPWGDFAVLETILKFQRRFCGFEGDFTVSEALSRF